MDKFHSLFVVSPTNWDSGGKEKLKDILKRNNIETIDKRTLDIEIQFRECEGSFELESHDRKISVMRYSESVKMGKRFNEIYIDELIDRKTAYDVLEPMLDSYGELEFVSFS